MPKVDLHFRVFGDDIPVDHGYHLFSSLSKLLAHVHDNDALGVHSINGRLLGNRRMALTERSRLILRTPLEEVKSLIPLAGKSLRIGDSKIRVGVPHVRPLVPSSVLYSRLVVIKGFMAPDEFLAAVDRQLDRMGVQGVASLVEQSRIAELNRNRRGGTRSPFLRRTIRIRGKEVVGFAVVISGLNEADSILVQEEGIGGRRRFGCGIFIPYHRTTGGRSVMHR